MLLSKIKEIKNSKVIVKGSKTKDKRTEILFGNKSGYNSFLNEDVERHFGGAFA